MEDYIGIFDSGMGGLSVAREIRKLLPNENLLYFADSAFCPYGTKEPAKIVARSQQICRFLLEHQAKMLVVACNTASIAGLDLLRKTFSEVPIVGMEPAVKPAATLTRNGRVGVLATGVTLKGDRFSSLIKRFAQNIQVFRQPCPGLVELVENGEIAGSHTEQLLKQYLQPLLEQQIDTLVLGCTHYPFLRAKIQEMVGDSIQLIDTGAAVAQQVKRKIIEFKLAAASEQEGRYCFYTSGDPEKVQQTISLLLNLPVEQVDYLNWPEIAD